MHIENEGQSLCFSPNRQRQVTRQLQAISGLDDLTAHVGQLVLGQRRLCHKQEICLLCVPAVAF